MKYARQRYSKTEVLCPFYIDHTNETRSIKCEGFGIRVTTTTKFPTIADQEQHMGLYCVGRYNRCPVYRCTYAAKYSD